MPKRRESGAMKRPRSAAVEVRSTSKSLQALERVLRPSVTEVRWKVDAPSGYFVQEVGRLASDLSRLTNSAGTQERIQALGRTLATLRTGISMANLANRLGGGNCFEAIDVPESDEDFDEENFEEEVICAIDPEKYARLLSAIEAWQLREFGEVSEKDIWMTRLPAEVIAEAGILVD